MVSAIFTIFCPDNMYVKTEIWGRIVERGNESLSKISDIAIHIGARARAYLYLLAWLQAR